MRTLGLVAALTLCWSVFDPLVAKQEPDVAGTPAASIQDDENSQALARLEGRVEGLIALLETERAISEKVLGTVQTVVTVYTGAVAAIALLLALFGYHNLRTHLEAEVSRQVEAVIGAMVDEKLNPVVRRKEIEWDERFEGLFRRIERLADSSSQERTDGRE